MDMTLEELKQKIDENLRKRNDFELAFTVLDSQLAHKKMLLTEIENALSGLHIAKNDLENRIKVEYADLIANLQKRKEEITLKENDISNLQMNLRLEQNVLDESKNKFNEDKISFQIEKDAFDSKLVSILGLLDRAQEVRKLFE